MGDAGEEGGGVGSRGRNQTLQWGAGGVRPHPPVLLPVPMPPPPLLLGPLLPPTPTLSVRCMRSRPMMVARYYCYK